MEFPSISSNVIVPIRGISIDPVAHPEETRRAQHPKADRINSSRGIGLGIG